MVEGGFGFRHVSGMAGEAIRKTYIHCMGNRLGQWLAGKGRSAAGRSHRNGYYRKG
jgi:hypothetical protein